MILDLFAGPGGWSEGCRELGLSEIGLEFDQAACATRSAAGHATIRADVANYPPPRARVEGLIASPPCPTFSSAGKGGGRDELPALHQAVHACLTGWRAPEGEWSDPRTPLVLEPLRWVDATIPEWVTLEQVPPVLPLWESMAHVFRAWGYRTWTGILNAADYGVPQTRRRAILMAHRTREVVPPPVTHARNPEPGLFGTLEPWVSMAEALGWNGEVGFPRADDRGTSEDGYGARDWRSTDEPAFGLTEKARSWALREAQAHGAVRTLDEPAMTISASADNGNFAFVNTGRDWKKGGSRDDAQKIPVTDPAPAIDGKGRWWLERPATTIAGDPRCWPPGHKVNEADRERLGVDEADAKYGDRAGKEAIKLTLADALVLQSFDPAYPVQGTRTKQFEQVGNAIPVRLAQAIVGALTG